jgi:hypothetical protein
VLAEIFLITGFNPITQYYLLVIFFGVFISASIYAILKAYKVNTYIAAASMLFVAYVANSGNLPGLWNLLPYTIGVVFLLWQIISQKIGKHINAVIYAILALIVYPPIVVFVFPLLFVGFVCFKRKFSREILYFFVMFGIFIFVFALIYLIVFAHLNITIIGVLSKYILRQNLDPGIPSYALWNVLPLFVILLAMVGMYVAAKNKYYDLLTVLGFGFLFWCVYAYVNKVFLIEYPRIVIITSIILVIFSGIGFQKVVEACVNVYDVSDGKLWVATPITKIHRHHSPNKAFAFCGILTIIICLFLTPFYTSNNPWQKFPLMLSHGIAFPPAPAVNRYLTEDDLRLFQSIKEQKFIAPRWKGLVIGVATHNFPLETKPSTITNKILLYFDFMDLNCQEKVTVAKQYDLHYVYSDPFSCPSFKNIGSSKEGLYLYKI